MKSLDFGRFALSMGVGAAMLASCGAGTTPGANQPSFTTSSSAQPVHRRSGSSGDLLYASQVNSTTVEIFSYPTGDHVGQVTIPNSSEVYGICSDSSGNVFVTAWALYASGPGAIYEYAHGGTSPIAELTLPDFYAPTGCAWDPTTGNLAVDTAIIGDAEMGPVAIFANASGTPTFYSHSDFFALLSATYDGAGDLFVQDQQFRIFELPKGGSAFQEIQVPRTVHPLYIQWANGKLATLSGKYRRNPNLHVYQLHISNFKAKAVGVTGFEQLGSRPSLSFTIDGSNIILPMGASMHVNALGIYAYPGGGAPEMTIQGYRVGYETVSVASPQFPKRVVGQKI